MEDNNLYLGAKGAVVAIDRRDGKEIWRTELKGSGFVLVLLDRNLVLAHTKGLLYALDVKSGGILWKNGLEGLGFGYATIASNSISPESVMPVIQKMAADAAAAAGAGAGAT